MIAALREPRAGPGPDRFLAPEIEAAAAARRSAGAPCRRAAADRVT